MSLLPILLHARWLAFRNWGRIRREQSRFKQVFVVLFAAALLAGLWALFLEGFQFLDRLGGVGMIIVPRLFGLFFFGLGAMLVLSSVLATYTTLYRSEEMPFLLLQPMTLSDIVVFKFLEVVLLASWAFFFIIIPFVGAYGWHVGLPWYFSLWTLLFSLPFVVICSAAGGLLTVTVLRWWPRTWVPRLGWCAVALLALAAWLIHHDLPAPATDDSVLVLNRLVPGLKFASRPLWPNWWIAEGLMAFTRQQWARGLMLWLVLVANAALLAWLVEQVGRRLFYAGWQRCLTGGGRARKRAVLLPMLDRALAWLPADVRCLTLKDVRLFLRDPQQWLQFLIFFGLLGIYFMNLRNFRYHLLPEEWQNFVAFLNVFSTSAVMCSMGSRFVYPQMSLEGQAFWVIGMAPTSMGRVLLAKFMVAALGLLTVSVGLMALSVHMLGLAPLARWALLGVAAAMAVTLAGLSTGLGAVFLDLRQRNAAAIVSGFGGTLNLVLSLAYMLLAVFPFAVLFHLRAMGHLRRAPFERGLVLASMLLAGLTVLGVVIPLLAGRRSLMRREY